MRGSSLQNSKFASNPLILSKLRDKNLDFSCVPRKTRKSWFYSSINRINQVNGNTYLVKFFKFKLLQKYFCFSSSLFAMNVIKKFFTLWKLPNQANN